MAVQVIKAQNPDCIVAVDNCYGEFTASEEPCAVSQLAFLLCPALGHALPSPVMSCCALICPALSCSALRCLTLLCPALLYPALSSSPLTCL